MKIFVPKFDPVNTQLIVLTIINLGTQISLPNKIAKRLERIRLCYLNRLCRNYEQGKYACSIHIYSIRAI